MSRRNIGPRIALGVLVVLLAACRAQTPPTPTPVPTTLRPAAPASAGSTDGQITPSPPPGGPTNAPTDSLEPTAKPGGAPPPTATPVPPGDHEREVWRTVPYATTGDCGVRLTECQQFVDVYAPDEPGPWPVVVMAHGRPRTPADMAELARAVSERGAVVFNIDYRGVRPVVQQGWPEAVDDVACAVRFARATAHLYGGDPKKKLVLVGHSFGGYVGTLVSLAGNEFHGDCLTPDESALPDAWVGVSANCTVGIPPPPGPLWNVWYGGTPEEAPRAWEKGDTLDQIGGNPRLVVRMIHERDDPIVDVIQPRTLVHELKEAGYDASLTVLDGDDHWGPLDLDEHAGRVTLDAILDLIGAS
jgi:acetyl esterase/lipase